MEPTQQRVMRVTTNDDKEFDIDWDVFRRMRTLVIEDDPELNPEGPVPVPNVSSSVFEKVLEYCDYHRNDPLPLDDDGSNSDDPRKRQVSEIGEWDQKFIQVDQEMLFEILLAANFLNIKGLLDLGCKTVANMIKGKTPEEIRKLFNIVNDFTEEEEAQIRKENEWAEDRDSRDYSMEQYRRSSLDRPRRGLSDLSARGRSTAWVRTSDQSLVSVPSRIFNQFTKIDINADDTSHSYPAELGIDIDTQTLHRVIDLCDLPFYEGFEQEEKLSRLSQDELFKALEVAQSLGIQSLMRAGIPAMGHRALTPVDSVAPLAPVASVDAAAEVIPDSYTIMLKEGCDFSAHIAWVKRLEKTYRSTLGMCELVYEYELINGYSATLKAAAFEEVRRSLDVEEILPNTIVKATMTQTDAPWNLCRISRPNQLPNSADVDALDFHHYHLPHQHNTTVNVYVLDSGVNIHHVDFSGRVRRPSRIPGKRDFPFPYGTEDGFGHGTHVAGTIGGTRWGVAKHARIIDMKILRDNGEGSLDDIKAGIQWVIHEVEVTKQASVINMSITMHGDVAFDRLCNIALQRGIHICIAAGNDAVAAPMRRPGVITVAASDIMDRRLARSNFGPNVSIFAPGEAVTSACFGCKHGHRQLSGTSMATPHVSGMIAYLTGREGSRNPEEMFARLLELAVHGTLNLDQPDTP